MSRFLSRNSDGTYTQEIESMETCKWKINEICCNGDCPYVADYPHPYCKCKSKEDCRYFEKEDGYRRKPMNKFHNQETIVDGIKFDSKKEAQRYSELKILQKAGEISNLELQPRFLLQESFKKNGKTYRKIEYVADFAYSRSRENGGRRC